MDNGARARAPRLRLQIDHGGGAIRSSSSRTSSSSGSGPGISGLADTISVGLESIAAPNTGPYRQTAHGFKIEPVIPFQLNADWNLVTRTTVPGMAQVRLSPDQGRIGGIGDINQIFALSPSHAGSLIWGVGPTISYPSASDPALGSGKWSAGPTVVALTMPGPWVLGILANNIWSFAGPSDRAPVNQLMAQYFTTTTFRTDLTSARARSSRRTGSPRAASGGPFRWAAASADSSWCRTNRSMCSSASTTI